jgi:lipid-binding SYLF domain-containing protein
MKAASIMNQFGKPEDQKFQELHKELEKKTEYAKFIPKDILKNAKGIAILTIVKGGFIVSGRAGSGLVIAKLENGEWSAPSAIATAGMGVGWQIGAEITDFVFILNTPEAVQAFYNPNVTIGGNVSIAAGPFGRSAEVSGQVTQKLTPIYSYSNSKGLFAGMSFEGSVIMERKEANEQFYREKVSAKEILSGFVPRPEAAKVFYESIQNQMK